MSSLSVLDSQMSHLKVSDDDMDDCSSQCSYYSLPDLKHDEWLRRIPASEVRKQAKLVPDETLPGVKYPRDLHNKEDLPLKVPGPWKEHPLCLNGRYMWGSPGPARVIVNPSMPDSYDVVYHPTRDDLSFRQAKYRPRGHKRGAIRKPGPQSPPTSPSSLPLQSPGGAPYQQYYGSPTFSNPWTSFYLQNPAMASTLQASHWYQPMPLNFSQWGFTSPMLSS
ncbi:hypothetical protein ACJ41O_001364 [Fusarium nematophilum]